LAGFIIAYIKNWRLALALTSIVPCIGITGALMNKAVSKYMQLSLNHAAEGGTIAEEVISTIRTAQAFGSQLVLQKIYNKFIGDSESIDLRAAIWKGAGMSIFFFIVYSSYGLGALYTHCSSSR
jgi:ATP-binding cassette, subfamily B (MDR/TAP), member 1